MAHLASRSARDGGLFVRIAYWMTRRRLGRVPAPIGIMAHHKAILAAVAGFELGLERATSVDAQLKELALVKVATIVGCRFCIDIGSALAQSHGVGERQLLALPSYDESPEFTELERQVLDYAVQMTETPSKPDPALFRALEGQLGVKPLVELTAAIAWENFRARFNHAVGAEEEGFSSGTVCLLPPKPEGARPLATEPLPALPTVGKEARAG